MNNKVCVHKQTDAAENTFLSLQENLNMINPSLNKSLISSFQKKYLNMRDMGQLNGTEQTVNDSKL